MKKIVHISLLGLIIIISLFVLKQQSIIKKQEDDKENYEYLSKSKSPNLEGINIISHIEYEDYYVLGVHYPVTNNQKINSEISELAYNHITEFKSDAEEFFTGPEPPGGFSSWKYELNIDYDIHRFSSEIFSFKFDVYMYTGGAHSIHEIITKSFNLESGEKLKLRDLFKEGSEYLNVISNLSYTQLIESGRLGDLFSENWVKKGTSPNEENFKNFTLTDNSMFFFFPAYQVGPWAAGDQYVEIEYITINSLLNSKFAKVPLEPEDSDKEITPEPPNPQIPEPPVIDDYSKVVALTFDDGPHPTNTTIILDELKKRNAVATFFVLGNRAQYYPELLARIISEGSEIGNHTWNHKQLTKLSTEEIHKQINDTQEIIKYLTDITPTIIRPPYGSVDKRVKQEINMPIILWSVDPEDWKNKNSDMIIGHILTKAKNGDIVLQHDLYEWTAKSVGPIIDDFIAKGYKFVTVSQLLGFDQNPSNAIAGKIYYLQQLIY